MNQRARQCNPRPFEEKLQENFNDKIIFITPSISAFLIPGAALWLPSGYSYGAIVLLLGAIYYSPAWLRNLHFSTSAACWAVTIMLMAGIWMLNADLSTGLRSVDKPAKYFLALICLGYTQVIPPKPTALGAGIIFGALAAGLKAIKDVTWSGLERAWGAAESTHNAIQYGDLSGLLGLMCWVMLWINWRQWSLKLRALVIIAGTSGLLGSLLSLSRGGWLSLLLCLTVLYPLLWYTVGIRRIYNGIVIFLLAMIGLIAFNAQHIGARLTTAQAEVTEFKKQGDAETSIGLRLAYGNLAWEMGRDHLLIGWGNDYESEKKRRVASGLAPLAVLNYGHAHNEILDMFSHHGLLGISILLLFYGVPFVLFYPTQKRLKANPSQTALTLRFVGLTIPLCYIGFGMTQVFFTHNSGNMFYLFMNTLILAILSTHPSNAAEDAKV